MSMDPFDTATAAGEFAGVFYGKLEVTAQHVILKKGVGKVPFDENIHDLKDRCTAVSILLNPIDATGLTRLMTRDMIAESREFNNVVWPSCRDLGLKNLRELHYKFAKAEMANTGRKWTTSEGEEREATTFKFVAFYADEAECTVAYYADTGRKPEDDAAVASNGGGVSLERDTALQFLPALVKQAGGDRAKLAELIANMPMISTHFTIDSSEVQALL